MIIDTDTFETSSPKFLEQTKIIKQKLQNLSDEQLQKIWKCSDSIAKTNIQRLQTMNFDTATTPAILAYEGLQYKHMGASVFSTDEFAYLDRHLRILSGFYGILKPLDGVVPYRLELQAKLEVGGSKDLYAFWGDKIANELLSQSDTIINLASKEYSKAITPYLNQNTKFITCTFAELKNEKLIEKGTMCKMARGEMVRFMAQNNVESLDGVKAFDVMGYKFSESYSNENNLVFIKGDK